MISKVRAKSISGDSVVWDGTNPEEVRQVAGEWFGGVWVQYAVILRENDVPVHAKPGWSITRLDDGYVLVTSPDARDHIFTGDEPVE